MLPRALGALLLTAACSAEPSESPPRPPLDTTVLDACLGFAQRLCLDADDCCQRQYGGFDLDGCVQTFKRDVCRPGADAVAAKRATFDADAVEACLAAHAAAHAVCVPSWAEALALRKEIYAACRVIDGLTKPGDGCSVTATCKRPEGLGTAECVKNVCRTVEVLPAGAPCPFPSGSVSVCDEGLTCDAPGIGTEGVCVDVPATGAACDPRRLESIECGLGSYCDSLSATCAVAENRGGAGCTQSTECVSFDCDRAAGECAPAPAVVDRATCLGPEP